MKSVENKPGTDQVGAISKAQKQQKDLKVSSFLSLQYPHEEKNEKLLEHAFGNFLEHPVSFATHDEDIDYFNMRIYIILIACVYIQQFNFVQ